MAVNFIENIDNLYCDFSSCSNILTIPIKMAFSKNYLVIVSRCPNCHKAYKSIFNINDVELYSTLFKVFFQCDICGADNSSNWKFMDKFNVNNLDFKSIIKISFRCNNCNRIRAKSFPFSIFEQYLKFINYDYSLDYEISTLFGFNIDGIKISILRKNLFESPDLKLDLSKLDLSAVSVKNLNFTKFMKDLNKLVLNGYFGPSIIEDQILSLKSYTCDCGTEYSPLSISSFCEKCGKPLWNGEALVPNNPNPTFSKKILRDGFNMISDIGSAINWILLKLEKDGIVDLLDFNSPLKLNPNDIIDEINDLIKKNNFIPVYLSPNRYFIKKLYSQNCPSCGSIQSIHFKFCEECGTSLV